MKLKYTEQPVVDRIAAIRAIRGLTGYNLKEAKDFVDAAQETGCAEADCFNLNHSTGHYNCLAANGFTLMTNQAELVDDLNHALDKAVKQRNYVIARLMLDAIDVATNGGSYHQAGYTGPTGEINEHS